MIVKNNFISFVNKAASGILGYEERELINTEFSSISQSPLTTRKLNEDDIDQNTTELIKLDLLKKNGGSITFEGDMSLITYMNSSAILLICKKPQKQKKKTSKSSGSSEALRLTAAVKSLKSAVTITDMEKNIVYVNPAHKNIFGYDSEDLIGNPGNILFSIHDPSGISDKIYDAIIAIGWEGERISIRKNGEVFPSFEKISLVKDQDGNPLGIVSIIDEITERKRLEQALKESEERYRTLVETASTAIIALDEKGKIILYNPSAEKIFLYSKPEIADKTMLSLIDEINEGVSYLDNLIGTTTELSGINKNGDKIPIEITLSKCIIEGENIYTAIILDITERKNLQNQLIQSARLAAIGELISGVTHEVKNPIAVVMGYSEMLLEEAKIDEETNKVIKIIFSESERAGKVLQNMLSFASQNTPNKKPVILNNIIDMTLELADFDLRKNTIKVIKKFDEGLPSILGESNQLKQVFLNILINAQQAIADKDSEGTITIETSKEITGEPGNGNGFVRVNLSDDGGGIPEEILNKIFDPFFTTKPEGVGTGLGLSVSLGIIKDHDGNIEVKSVENEGTSFDIRFPLHKID
jgi:PAS domain S-box-containing protein